MTVTEQKETRTGPATVPLSLVLCEKIIAIVRAHNGGGVVATEKEVHRLSIYFEQLDETECRKHCS